jgi:hypothetical protein
MAKKSAKKVAKKPAAKKSAPKQPAAKKPAKPQRTPQKATSASLSHAALVRNAVEHTRFVHTMIYDWSKGFDEAKATAQAPGNMNHLLWTYGHLAHSYDWFTSALATTSKACPANYKALFGGGSKPTSDPKAYPSLAQVRAEFDAARDRFIKAIETTPDLFAKPLMDGGGWLANKMQAVDRNAWHVGWHLGQLSNLRRELGMAPLMQ